jgi:hypothetical protein
MSVKILIAVVFSIFTGSAVGCAEEHRDESVAATSKSAHLITVARDARLQLTMHRPTVVMTDGGYQPYLFCTGVDIYDTAEWEDIFVNKKAADYVPTDEMIGDFVDPDLIEMRNGALVCAVGARIPARKSLFANWRAPQNGNYLMFGLDGGDTWSHVVQYTSGVPTTHYAGVGELSPDLLYVVYDNSIWKGHVHLDGDHDTMGFQLAVRRIDLSSHGD